MGVPKCRLGAVSDLMDPLEIELELVEFVKSLVNRCCKGVAWW